MNSAESFQWPDAAVETLIKLRAEGLSSSQIGAALGVSRNAVIGKAARLGLPCAVSVTQYRPTSRRERRPQGLAHGDRRLTQVLSKPRLPVEPLPVVEPAPEHVFLNVGLLDLNRDECRYSPSKEPPFLFCGQPALAGKSWCQHCYGLTHQGRQLTESDRDRRREWGHVLGLRTIRKIGASRSPDAVSRYLIDPEVA